MFISDETLRVIHLVARHQSITTAAEQLNKVPSAISYTIKKAVSYTHLTLPTN